MNKYLADLHIHTCLSPCADDEMIPLNILNMAKLGGTKVLGICDHNSGKNLPSMQKAARNYDILLLPGIEVESIEEVHILCFFPEVDICLGFQDIIYSHLPKLANRSEIFGHQWIVDEEGNILGEEEQLLLTSTQMNLDEIRELVKKLGGIFIPAHIDRRSFSIFSQLGFMPEDLYPDALEYSRFTDEKSIRQKLGIPRKFPLITSSDAHKLSDMVYQKTWLYMKSLSFTEIKKALQGEEGRRVVLEG